MANFKKTSLQSLRDRAISTINTYVSGADANLRRRVLNVIATVLAGMGDEILRRVDYLIKQIFIQEADEEYLIKHGQMRRFPRKMSQKASGAYEITGNQGAIIPKDTKLKRADNVIYTSIEEAIISSEGNATVKIEADDVGKNGNASAGTTISFTSPVPGVSTHGKVDSFGLTGGSDIEEIESYRERLLFFIQNPSTGGSKTDYIIWAKEIPGVTRAWCYPTESGAGTVTVRFMMDYTYADGIPLPGDVQRVKEHIATKQPATATVYIEAPIPDPMDFVFESLYPMTTESEADVENKLKSLIQSSSSEPGGSIKLSKINGAISNATGNEDFKLITPNSDINLDKGHISILGSITYPEVENT